jgi:hypothetical protein
MPIPHPIATPKKVPTPIQSHFSGSFLRFSGADIKSPLWGRHQHCKVRVTNARQRRGRLMQQIQTRLKVKFLYSLETAQYNYQLVEFRCANS